MEALVDYVIYLSIRGESERRLIAAAIDQLGYDDSQPPPELRLSSQDTGLEGSRTVRETIVAVAKSWQAAADAVVPAEGWKELQGEPLRQSIARGHDLFHGQIANCVGCHGPAGNGQAITVDYDDWAKEYSTRLGVTPTDREAMRPFRSAGALPPRQTEPRKLDDGVFRGAGDPEAIFRQISQGIAGTPMPSVQISSGDSDRGTGLTTQQAWDLVRYVRSLGN